MDLESARAFVTAVIKQAAPPRRGVRSAADGCHRGSRRRYPPLERRAVLEVGHEAGLRKVGLIPEPVAGALGCGINPLEPRTHLVVDIGGGTSEVTALCFGGVLSHRSCRIAGDDLTRAIHRYLRAEHQILVGELTAERAKVGAPETTDEQSLVVEAATPRPGGRDWSPSKPRRSWMRCGPPQPASCRHCPHAWTIFLRERSVT